MGEPARHWTWNLDDALEAKPNDRELDELIRKNREEDLSSARGVVGGMVIGAGMWLGLLGTAWLVF